MINRLCGSIGCYTSYSIDVKELFVLFISLSKYTPRLFNLKEINWKLLFNIIVISVYSSSFTFKVTVNIN